MDQQAYLHALVVKMGQHNWHGIFLETVVAPFWVRGSYSGCHKTQTCFAGLQTLRIQFNLLDHLGDSSNKCKSMLSHAWNTVRSVPVSATKVLAGTLPGDAAVKHHNTTTATKPFTTTMILVTTMLIEVAIGSSTWGAEMHAEGRGIHDNL